MVGYNSRRETNIFLTVHLHTAVRFEGGDERLHLHLLFPFHLIIGALSRRAERSLGPLKR